MDCPLSSPVPFAPLNQCHIRCCRVCPLHQCPRPPLLSPGRPPPHLPAFPGDALGLRGLPFPCAIRLGPFEPPWQTRPTHPSPRARFSSSVVLPCLWLANGPAPASALSGVHCPPGLSPTLLPLGPLALRLFPVWPLPFPSHVQFRTQCENDLNPTRNRASRTALFLTALQTVPRKRNAFLPLQNGTWEFDGDFWRFPNRRRRISDPFASSRSTCGPGHCCMPLMAVLNRPWVSGVLGKFPHQPTNGQVPFDSSRFGRGPTDPGMQASRRWHAICRMPFRNDASP
jgi:hypothetical protein